VTKKSIDTGRKVYLDDLANLNITMPGKHPDFKNSQIQAIVKAHKINDSVLIKEFYGQIRYAAGVYFQYLDYFKSRPTRKTIQQNFKALGVTAKNLKGQLKAIQKNDHADYVFNMVSRDMETEFGNAATALFLNQPNQKSQFEKIGLGWIKKHEDVSVSSDYLKMADVHAVLDYLLLISVGGVQQLAHDKKGNPGDKALLKWVQIMVTFWVRNLNRKFTLDYHGKTITSPIGSFLEDCLRLIDPAAIPRLSGALRRLHKARKKTRKK
jgi:hypothetical protein